jgi:histidinol-phosphate/aromatic aminotransferase/cobyric acid decarboxylase-like protein
MALSRRGFVRTVGIGAAAAWVGARGRENAIWSAVEAPLGAVDPGVIVLASNENPLGPGKTVMRAVRNALSDGGKAAGRYSG